MWRRLVGVELFGVNTFVIFLEPLDGPFQRQMSKSYAVLQVVRFVFFDPVQNYTKQIKLAL